MPLLVVEGPENSGKDRMIHQVLQRWRGSSMLFHHFEGDSNHARVMEDMEFVEAHPTTLVIFNRWWLSELVYRTVQLDDPPTIFGSAFEVESCYGGLADRYGVRLLLTGDPDVLRARHTPNDIDIHPLMEMRLYHSLAAPGWNRVGPDYDMNSVWHDIILPGFDKRLLVPHWERNNV